jgi:hypothetical protein
MCSKLFFIVFISIVLAVLPTFFIYTIFNKKNEVLFLQPFVELLVLFDFNFDVVCLIFLGFVCLFMKCQKVI